MKKILLPLAFAILATPHLVRANGHHDDDDDRDWKHSKKIDAKELSAIGFASAMALCGAGYLALRRRKSA